MLADTKRSGCEATRFSSVIASLEGSGMKSVCDEKDETRGPWQVFNHRQPQQHILAHMEKMSTMGTGSGQCSAFSYHNYR